MAYANSKLYRILWLNPLGAIYESEADMDKNADIEYRRYVINNWLAYDLKFLVDYSSSKVNYSHCLSIPFLGDSWNRVIMELIDEINSNKSQYSGADSALANLVEQRLNSLPDSMFEVVQFYDFGTAVHYLKNFDTDKKGHISFDFGVAKTQEPAGVRSRGRTSSSYHFMASKPFAKFLATRGVLDSLETFISSGVEVIIYTRLGSMVYAGASSSPSNFFKNVDLGDAKIFTSPDSAREALYYLGLPAEACVDYSSYGNAELEYLSNLMVVGDADPSFNGISNAYSDYQMEFKSNIAYLLDLDGSPGSDFSYFFHPETSKALYELFCKLAEE